MTEEPDDIHAPRAFDQSGYVLRQWPYALGLIALGAFALAGADAYSYSDRKLLLAGTVLLCAGLGAIALGFYRRAHPGPPALVLSADGVHTRMGRTTEAFIPWDEVRDIQTFSFSRTFWTLSGTRPISFRNVNALIVSDRFYRQRLHVDSFVQRGPFWNYYYIRDGNEAAVTVLHEFLDVSSQDVGDALRLRWRAFSNAPKARLPEEQREASPIFNQLPLGAKRALAALTSPFAKIAGLIVALFIVVFAAYYWRYPLAWIKFPDLPEGSRTVYLRDLLASSGVPARTAAGKMVLLRSADISTIGTSECPREIARDISVATSFGPAYRVSGHCIFHLGTRSGETALGIFRIFVKHSQMSWKNYDGTTHTQDSDVIAAETQDLASAEAKLCELGYCKTIVAKPD